MIFAIVRTAMAGLRRDRAALALSFVLPLAFFSIFAVIFGGQHDTVPRIKLIVVDEDQSTASQQLVSGLERDSSLVVSTRPASKANEPKAPGYTAASAEAAVKAGDVSVALVIPQGWGQNPVSFGPANSGPAIELLNDTSDAIAPQVVAGLLQKAAMTAMPAVMAEKGTQYTEQFVGEFTPEQRKRAEANLAQLRKYTNAPASSGSSAAQAPAGLGDGGLIAVHARSVMGQSQNKNLISFYAAAIGVMFLLFTASSSAGALLDEAESGTLDRVLSSRVTMTTLLAGKLTFNMLWDPLESTCRHASLSIL